MNKTEAIAFLGKQRDTLGYRLEMAERVPCRTHYEQMRSALTVVLHAIESLTAENAAKDAEIERLKDAILDGYAKGLGESQADLARVTEERDTIEKKAIAWGTDLIESETDGHAAVCDKCGFPIVDYGANPEIYCGWCKAKNISKHYVPTGPGYCRTTADRKSGIYDKLFHSGRGPKECD